MPEFHNKAELDAARSAGQAAAFNRALGDDYKTVVKRNPYPPGSPLAEAWHSGVRRHFTINANWHDQDPDAPHSGNKAFTERKRDG